MSGVEQKLLSTYVDNLFTDVVNNFFLDNVAKSGTDALPSFPPRLAAQCHANGMSADKDDILFVAARRGGNVNQQISSQTMHITKYFSDGRA